MDMSAAPQWPLPATPEERQQWIEIAAAAGIDGEAILRRREKAGQRVVEMPTRWVPLSDQEWREIEPFMPASVRGARGAPPRKMLDLLLYRAATRTTAWRGTGHDCGIDPDNARQKWTRWVLAGVLDRLLGARVYLKLAPGRQEQLDALEKSVMEEWRRQQQREAAGVGHNRARLAPRRGR